LPATSCAIYSRTTHVAVWNDNKGTYSTMLIKCSSWFISSLVHLHWLKMFLNCKTNRIITSSPNLLLIWLEASSVASISSTLDYGAMTFKIYCMNCANLELHHLYNTWTDRKKQHTVWPVMAGNWETQVTHGLRIRLDHQFWSQTVSLQSLNISSLSSKQRIEMNGDWNRDTFIYRENAALVLRDAQIDKALAPLNIVSNDPVNTSKQRQKHSRYRRHKTAYA
jgi:hypothetical protein